MPRSLTGLDLSSGGSFRPDKTEPLAGQAGRRVDETSPMVDSRLPDGSRINAIIPPLALDGALVSIRRFGVKPIQAGDLVANKSLTVEMLEFLGSCVRARLNILVS